MAFCSIARVHLEEAPHIFFQLSFSTLDFMHTRMPLEPLTKTNVAFNNWAQIFFFCSDVFTKLIGTNWVVGIKLRSIAQYLVGKSVQVCNLLWEPGN